MMMTSHSDEGVERYKRFVLQKIESEERKKMSTIFEISQDMQDLEAFLIEAGGDITDPEVEKKVVAWMDKVDKDWSNKVENYCQLINEMEARAKARKDEAKRLAARADIDLKSASALKERLLFVMESRNMKKTETPSFRISVAKNGGKKPLDLDLDNVSKEYLINTVVTSVDKDKIRADLEAGADLVFATFVDRGTHLRIK